MAFLTRRPPARVPHVEPGFNEPDFVAEYSAETRKFPVEFALVFNFLSMHLDPARPAEVLEIGPGPGWMAILLAKSHPAVQITGIDLSEAFVALANENSRREGVAERVRFTLGDAATMDDLRDQSFDVVMSHQSLHYWDPPERVFNQIARVLKPFGVFCISDDRRDMNWRGALQVLLGRYCLSRRIGASWKRSVSGCLTVAEAGDALGQSKLKNRGQIAMQRRTMLIHSIPGPGC